MYFAAGGEYGVNREFRLVGTTGEGSTPYVATNETWAQELFHATRHHAHLYRIKRLPNGQFMAEVDAFGDSQEVGGPNVALISGTLALNLSCLIAAQDFWGESLTCSYCGGNCVNEPNDSDYLCDGFAGNIDNLPE